jgi:hypothetical protein
MLVAMVAAGAIAISAVAGTAIAAPAPLSTGFGTDANAILQPDSGAVLPTVSAGDVAVFQIWARNDGPTTNIPQLYLAAMTSGTFYGAITSQGSCAAGPPSGPAMLCTFGSLAPSEVVYVTAAFTTPSGGDTMPLSFEWSTTGYVKDKGKNQSRGDAFVQPDSVTLSNDAHFDGRVAFDDSLLSTLNTQIATLDVQTLQAEINRVVPLVLIDGAGANFDCTTDCPPAFLGDPILVNVDNGFTFENAFMVQWLIPGVVPSQITGIFHLTDEGVGETITTQFAAGATPTEFPSFSLQKVNPKATLVTLWTTSNGNYRGY